MMVDPQRFDLPRAGRRPRRTAAAVLLLLLAALCAGEARAEDPLEALAELPGFVSARELGIAEPREQLAVEVNLVGPILAFLAEAGRAADPEMADALSRLKSVRAEIYRLRPKDVPEAKGTADRAARRLEREGWLRVVTLKEGEAQTYLYTKSVGSELAGLVALFVSEERQLGFINIAGRIDPAQIGRIARKLNLQGLDGLDGTPPR